MLANVTLMHQDNFSDLDLSPPDRLVLGILYVFLLMITLCVYNVTNAPNSSLLTKQWR